jgi:hypothetical protein
VNHLETSALHDFPRHAPDNSFGDLRGVTSDPSGLPLPAAPVTVHSLDENSDRKVTSGDDGSFLVEIGVIEK